MTATRAWAWLLGLSALSTLAAALPPGPWLVLAVLALAWGKARLILNRYLRLAEAPAIARGFALVLGACLILMAGLAILPDLAAG
jgi:hypothetical protein